MKKALARLNREEVMWKANHDQVLNLLELSLVTGYSYEQWSCWKRRGLPLVQGKISAKRAMDWVMSEEMIPESQTSQLYDYCNRVTGALANVSLDLLTGKPNAALRDSVILKIDAITREHTEIRRNMVKPSKPAGPPGPKSIDPNPEEIDTLPESTPPTIPAAPPSLLTEDVELAVQMAKAGLTLNLQELARALGYSYSKMLQWKKDGLPLMDGRITKDEALAWRKIYLGQEAYSIEPRSPVLVQPPPPESSRSPFRRRFKR